MPARLRAFLEESNISRGFPRVLNAGDRLSSGELKGSPRLKTDKKVLIVTLVYLIVLTFFHWGLRPNWDILFFLAGGLVGVDFLEMAEAVFKISPSPFRNVLFQSVAVPLSLFVLTSSGSLFGAGLILSMFLGMVILQYQEFSKNGNIQSWFWVVKTEVKPRTQQIYFLVIMVILIFLSLLFT